MSYCNFLPIFNMMCTGARSAPFSKVIKDIRSLPAANAFSPMHLGSSLLVKIVQVVRNCGNISSWLLELFEDLTLETEKTVAWNLESFMFDSLSCKSSGFDSRLRRNSCCAVELSRYPSSLNEAIALCSSTRVLDKRYSFPVRRHCILTKVFNRKLSVQQDSRTAIARYCTVTD